MLPRSPALLLVLGALACSSGSDAPDPSPDAAPPPDAAADLDARAPRPDAGPPPFEPSPPDLVCPGDPTCPSASGTFEAGAAAVDITPSLDDAEPFEDLNLDGEWSEGEPFEDRNGNGTRDGIWIAGFGQGRAATEVLDPQWARAVAFRRGETTLALVSVDCVGLFLDDADAIREAVADAVDYALVAATHSHQARDTIGLWGPSTTRTGLDPEFQQAIREGAAQAIREAVAALEPARVQHAHLRLSEVDAVTRWVGDLRDPQVIDDEVRVLRVLAADDTGDTGDEADPLAARTVATLVNFGSHPEYLGSSNTGLSSDWPHFLRRALEEGVAGGPVPGPGEPLAPVGGVTVFVQGAIGSQIGPNDIAPRDWDGAPVPDERRARTEAVGTQLGALVLRALREGEPDLEERPELAFRRARLFVPVANRLYRYAGEAGIMQRSLYNYDPDRRIDDRNVPDLQTEVAVLRIGRAAMLTVPGELDPVEWIGGYAPPCPYTPGGCDALVDEDAENPPDLARAPAGPYLRDRLAIAFPEASELWLLGMTNDFLGYFIPEFDFEVDPVLPYLVQAPGAHYEETNAVGPEGWPRVRAQLISLLQRD